MLSTAPLNLEKDVLYFLVAHFNQHTLSFYRPFCWYSDYPTYAYLIVLHVIEPSLAQRVS